jgi:23S rRNA (cytidine1920-2'-O)/16S rRNA (cytidine1409-2'-O)-methyltransferase
VTGFVRGVAGVGACTGRGGGDWGLGAGAGSGTARGGATVAQPPSSANEAISKSAVLIFMPRVWKRAAVTSTRPAPSPSSNAPKATGKAKLRLDQLLVERGLAESRARAQALILAGHVYSGETKLTKAGQALPAEAPLEVRGRDHPWVSRGGIKLGHAIAHFGLDPAGVTAMDIGSSTGGFTDVLLSLGAAHVFAVDSGTNQLAWKLRQDPRVTVLEQLSARLLTQGHIDRPATWVVCDASFIALHKVLEVPLRLAARPTQLVALIKPQFEVGRGEVGKGGVVRDAALHARVCDEVRGWLEGEGWAVQGITTSPITGPEGNIEFLISAILNEAA